MAICEQSKFSWIDGFAEELDELVYEGMSNWFVSFRSPMALFGGHFSYLVMHLSIIACGIMTLQHAKANGPRYLQFWWGAMIHGILSENGITSTKYWHAQAVIMLFGKRLPLHMVFFYPSVLYLAVMAVQKFNLSIYSEPAAIGMLAMIMEIPFRIISVKFLHITYHDSDPIYASKFYGVPWIEIFTTLVFATSYATYYYALKYHFLSEDHVKWENAEYDKKEAMVTAASGMLSPLLGFLQKVLFFHVLYDSFNINPSTCLLFLCTIYFSLVFCLEGKEEEEKDSSGKAFLYYALGIYVTCLLYIAMLCRPQNEISIGCHEPTGDCTTLICSRSPLGKETRRRKYLCTDGERQEFYNFTCVPGGAPCLYAIWYTICGTPFRDRNDFVLIVAIFSVLVLVLFTSFKFGKTERYKRYLVMQDGWRTSADMAERPMNLMRMKTSVLRRKKYLCVDDVQERSNFVYNFACLPDGPPYLNAIWYTVCGTSIRNRAQFITNIFSFIILISTIFLKGLLTPDEKARVVEKVKRRISMLKGITRLIPERSHREPVVTFEEPRMEDDEEPAAEDPD